MYTSTYLTSTINGVYYLKAGIIRATLIYLANLASDGSFTNISYHK